ncbi:hypothetical protein ACHAWX_000831 [Stephanocyclus meneghinianus]
MSRCRLDNEDMLERIRRIDPEVKEIKLYFNAIKQGAVGDFSTLGHCIGQNKSINKIVISHHNLFDPQNEVNLDCHYSGIPSRESEVFFNAVSQSRSIKRIFFRSCCLGGHILKLFDTPNLERADFEECIITNQTASAIRRVSGLQCVQFIQQLTYCNITDMADFITSLNHNYKLEYLFFLMIDIKEEEVRALGDIFLDPLSIIKKLGLVDCRAEVHPLLPRNGLRNGLVYSSSLCELVLHENDVMRVEDWQVVSDVLSSPVTALKALDIGQSQIDDVSAVALATGLAYNTTLEELDLSSLGLITAAGWLSIFSSLGNSNVPLKKILLRFNDEINDEAVSSFGEVLTAKKDTIEEFSLHRCRGITAAGRVAIDAACLTLMPNLSKLQMGNANFDDDAMIAFACGLYNKPSLAMVELGNATITRTGWEAISKILCGASSLNAILESNHTLHEIEVYPQSLPPNIKKLLEINRSGTPSEVAHLKIVDYCDEINIGALVSDQLEVQFKLVPSVISWLGEDWNNHNALYNFIRNQSYLLEWACKNGPGD